MAKMRPNVFEELSLELPVAERHRLHDRIARRLKSKRGQEIMRIGIEGDERVRIVDAELATAHWWVRLNVWLRGLFSTDDRPTRYLDLKLARLRAKIKQINPELVSFEQRSLSSTFARNVYQVYRAVYSLQPFIGAFVRDPRFIQDVFVYLVESKLPDPIRHMRDLITGEELADILYRTSQWQEVKNELLRRLNKYLGKIPETIYDQLREGTLPIVHLRALVLFPFASLFNNFSHLPDGDPVEQSPQFSSASVSLILDQIEQLYHGIYVANKLGEHWELHKELAGFFYAGKSGDPARQPGKLLPKALLEGYAPMVASLVHQLRRAIKTAEQFLQEVPLLDIIRYYQRDPYYSFVFTLPRYSLADIYSSELRKRFTADLEALHDWTEREVIERRSREIFSGRSLLKLENYNDAAVSETAEPNRNMLSHVRSATLLYSFVAVIYKETMKDALQFLHSRIGQTDRILTQRIAAHVAGMDDLKASVEAYDQDLAPDREAGEALHRISTNVGLRSESRRFLLTTVSLKDSQAAEVVAQGIGQLQGLQRTIDDILGRDTVGTLSILKPGPVRQVLEKCGKTLGNFTTLLAQLLEHESKNVPKIGR